MPITSIGENKAIHFDNEDYFGRRNFLQMGFKLDESQNKRVRKVKVSSTVGRNDEEDYENGEERVYDEEGRSDEDRDDDESGDDEEERGYDEERKNDEDEDDYEFENEKKEGNDDDDPTSFELNRDHMNKDERLHTSRIELIKDVTEAAKAYIQGDKRDDPSNLDYIGGTKGNAYIERGIP
ncbi:hypothetical protein Syun_001450 [Stephania yunnanensis]|uniref:Uncharacterized protein n=1 Tax=Stephania yunnanensis TaxID=152371 RepID=A0AAP0LER3_9MAGN